MTALAEQQRLLKQAIVADADASGLLRASPGREPLLGIYRGAYRGRLISALRDNFGVLPTVFGDDGFEALALAYIEAHPSPHASIRWFGDRLAAFMAANEALVPHPALTDLARMEWALREAFDAGDGVALGVDALAGVPADAWPTLVFDALPSTRLLRLSWSIEPVWRVLRAAGDEAPDMPEPEAMDHGLIVWRQGLETRWRAIDTAAADLLEAALSGASFGALCELAATNVDPDQAALAAASALRGWLDDGFFSGWRTAS